MNFRTFGIVRAAEEMDSDVVTTEGGDEGLEMDSDVVEQEATIDAADAAGNAAIADVETLEEIKEVLEDAAESGDGIDETAAKVVEVAVESIYARLGMEYRGLGTSAESFGSSRSRVTATNIAAESIGDSISRAWEAIKKFFKKIWTYIKDFAKSIFTAIGRLKVAANKMFEKVNKSGKDKREENFTNSFIVSKFADGSSIKSADDIIAGITDVKKGLDDLAGIKKNLEAMVKGKDDTEKLKALKAIMTGLADSSPEVIAKLGVNTTEEFASTIFVTPTGVAVAITMSKDSADAKKASETKTRARVEAAQMYESTKDVEISIDVVELNKLRDISRKVGDMANSAETANKDEKYLKNIDSAIDALKGKVEIVDSTTAVKTTVKDEMFNVAVASIRAALSLGKGVSTKPITVAVKSGFDCLKYVSTMLAQYK